MISISEKRFYIIDFQKKKIAKEGRIDNNDYIKIVYPE